MNAYGLMLGKFVGIENNKPLLLIRIDGDFKVYVNNNGNKSYSLAISVDESNEKFFKSLEFSLSGLASSSLGGKSEDFKLIKESKNYRNVYCKIYMNPSGVPKCLYSESVSGKRKYKRLEDAAFETFKGTCIVCAFSGKTKGITICTDEILNYDSKKSYFDEFPEE